MEKNAQHRQHIQSKRAQVSAERFNKKAIVVYVAMMFTSNGAEANPTGGEFAQGMGAISNTAGLTTIQQTTQQAIVNWQSFGSNAGEVIKFVQPNANAAILNRVVGSLPSNLNGLLEGNGRVYLVNPNGIVLGANGVINVNGGFVASTQGISDSAFMQGGALVFSGENTGNIQILGKIQSAQGDIVIIAPKTEITAGAELKAGQNIQLIAANEVQLSNGKFTVTPKLSDAGQLTVAGTLEAAKVQLEAHNNNLGALAINTTGTIRATGTQTNPDGSVSIMAYGDGSNIKVSGNISAQNNDPSKEGGRIVVGRDEATGELAKSADVSGATFTTNKGFVETSGHHLITDGAQVIAKDWLLDPDNIDITGDATNPIAGYSKIKASDITNNLNKGTSVTIATTASARENQPAYVGVVSTGDGNIVVNADIVKSASQDANGITLANGATNSAKLTLLADNGINVNAAIGAATGAGKLNVTLKAGNTTATGGITLNSPINANGGDVILQTQGGRILNAVAGTITGNNITLDNTGGTISTTGAITGRQKTGASQGVYLFGGVTASGNLNVAGVTGGGGAVGVQFQGSVVKGASVNIYAESALERGFLAFSNAQVEATGGDLNITAKSTSTGSSAFDAQGGSLLKAARNITIDGTHSSTTQPAVSLTGSGVTSTSGNITITADSLNLTSTVTAINKTVTIQNKTAGVKVALGGNDDYSASNRMLGLNLTELSKITAGNLIVGSSTAGGLTVKSEINNTGSISLVAGGTISVDQTLTASGDISITSQTSQKTAILINKDITSSGGNVTLNGTTSETALETIATANGNIQIPYAAIKSAATVKGKDITMNAHATGETGTTLGYYGAGSKGKFIASGNLSLTASSANAGNGFYMFAGELTGNTIAIDGQSAGWQGVGFDNNVVIASGSTLSIKGAASDANPAISLHGVSMTASGDVSLKATSGNITVATNNPWNTQALTNTITQSNTSSGNIALTTIGNGNITVPLIVNKSAGDVVVAAGSDLLAGNGAGGQVKFATGNTITNNNGRTYIYTGNVANSANMSDLNSAFGGMVLLGSGQNTKSNAAYNEKIANSSAVMQVMYRENIKAEVPSTYSTSTLSNDAVLLTPITFGFGVVGGATAAGGEVEGSCDAWSQRAGAGSISVVSLLKPSYMGLRTAKTDTMDAMAGSQATGSVADSNDNPCASAALANNQASL